MTSSPFLRQEVTNRFTAGTLGLALLLGLASPPARAATVIEVGSNFTGSRSGIDSNAEPADGDGAVGLDHFVEFINGRFSVYEKASGNRVRTFTDLEFWRTAGVALSAELGVTDPRVIFDPGSQRWFASMVDFNETSTFLFGNHFLLAVSETDDPTKAWHGLRFEADPVNGYFADFPTLGLDANGVYLGGDMFSPFGNSVGPALVAIPKLDLLADPPSADGRTFLGLLSYGLYGHILQPAVTLGEASSSEAVLAVGDLGLDAQPHTSLRTCTIESAADPGQAAVVGRASITVPAYVGPLSPTQPAGVTTLDGGDARFSAIVYRMGDILYAVHTVEINNRSALQWFKLNAVTHAIIQTGTITHATLNLFFPSIAANPAGTVVIACNGCSSKAFIGSYAVVGDLAGNVLTFGELVLLKAGTAAYNSQGAGNDSRWGDYSATSLDPTDPQRFWTIQMVPLGTSTWSTQITELITGPLRLSIAMTSGNIVLSWPSTATGFRVQATFDLTPSGTWNYVAASPATVNNRFVLTLPAAGEQRYFRLAKP